jgi:hypothetical protein
LTFKVGKLLLQNLLRKTPYGVCERCRGLEIYNFRIQSFVHFCTNFWSYSNSNQFSAKQFVPGTLCAATLHHEATSVRPCLGIRAVRHPRPPAGRGSSFPMRRTPRLLRVLSGPHAPCRAVPARGSLRPPVCRPHPAVRTPAEVAVIRRHLRRHGDVTGEALPIKTKCRHHPPCATPSRRPPLPPSHRTRLLARIPSWLATLTYILGPLEACAVASLPGIARRRRSHRTPRPSPPATAVRHHRVPLHPNFQHPRALGELTLLPVPLHGQERHRPHRILAARAAGHG